MCRHNQTALFVCGTQYDRLRNRYRTPLACGVDSCVCPQNIAIRDYSVFLYLRIKRALRETITAHSDGVKLLERSVQPIYAMKGLASLLATDDGENQVLKRLDTIDLARSFLNSIAIDSDGEEYDFKQASFTGIKEVIDSTCNMLSALTNIPQTILYGRSPAGQNSTGESDLENYYNFICKIQRLMLRKNLNTLLSIIEITGKKTGKLSGDDEVKLKFKPLWSLSEKEQAEVDQTKAQTAQVKAQTAQAYVDMQALDPSEVRAGLAADSEYEVEELIDESDGDLVDDLDYMLEKTGDNESPLLQSTQSGGIINKKSNPSRKKENLDFDESEHPRDKKGKFSSKNGRNKLTVPEAAKVFTASLKGTVASNGVVLKIISGHGAYRMKTKGISTEMVRDALVHPDATYPGNFKHKDATCFQKNGKRIVFSASGVVISTVDLEDDDDLFD